MVVHRNRQDPLGLVLADDIIVEDLFDFLRFRQLLAAAYRRFIPELLFDDLVAELDALVADIDSRTGHQFFDLLLQLAAE